MDLIVCSCSSVSSLSKIVVNSSTVGASLTKSIIIDANVSLSVIPLIKSITFKFPHSFLLNCYFYESPLYLSYQLPAEIRWKEIYYEKLWWFQEIRKWKRSRNPFFHTSKSFKCSRKTKFWRYLRRTWILPSCVGWNRNYGNAGTLP